MFSTEKAKSQDISPSSLHPLQNGAFIRELIALFRKQPITLSSSQLIEAFSQFKHLPYRWSGRKVKIFLSQQGFLSYQRSKPAGYILDISAIDEFRKKGIIEEEVKKSKSESSKKPKISSTSITVSQESILQTIPNFPQYLLKRMPKQARSAFRLGLSQINSLSSKKIDIMIEYLTAAKIFFDTSYTNERELVAAIDQKIRFMSEISEKRHNENVDKIFQKTFTEFYNSGKFSSIIKNWGEKYQIEECAYQIWKKMGRKAKKILISDYALRKMIVSTLKEKFPEKSA